MNGRFGVAIVAGAVVVVLLGQGAGGLLAGTQCTSVGPDVIVGDIPNVSNYTSEGGIEAFAIGTTSCNVGDVELNWFANTNQHPVISQNMYRWQGDRFEHIGQAWLKHGFAALQLDACGCGCIDSGTSTRLGVGCSDPYSSGLNGQQGGLGPKYEVNAHTGDFAYPYDDPSYSGTVARRLQVKVADLDPTLDGGGTYFVESQYVTPDDAAALNQDNNASYRQVAVSGSGAAWSISLSGMPPTQRERAGIRAWADQDPSVEEVDVRVPGEGLLILAAKATDIGGGWWAYEYALQNLNSDRSVGSFSLPVGGGIQNVGFHDVDYHSGEPWDGTDWPDAVSGGVITWATDDHATNPNANALRWGTLYNFRFESTAPPTTTTVTMGLFKPGTPTSVTASIVGPTPGPADCNNNGVDDDLDISGGTSLDCNANSIPDECEPDCDADGVPNACEPDADLDGIVDDCDNCPNDANPLQGDHDNDGVGNACDPDYMLGVILEDDFETDKGWTTEVAGATSGDWDRGVPVDDAGWEYDPASDSDGSGQCYLTENATGNTDVDGGAVRLTTPVLAMAAGGVEIRYDYFLRLTNSDGGDRLLVEISGNGLAGPWTTIATHAADQGLAWTPHVITQADLDAAGVTMTSDMRLRFTANDADAQSIVEAGVDAVLITTVNSFPDCNANGIDDAVDISAGTSQDCNVNAVPDECEQGAGETVTYDHPVAPPISIPDGTGGFVADTFTVPDAGTINDLDVELDITHTYNGDLIVRLTHGGVTAILVDRPGYSGSGFGFGNDGFAIVLDDEGTGGDIENVDTGGPTLTSPPSYVPQSPLSVFDGMDKAGDWILEVSDNAGSDVGTLDRWALVVTGAGSTVDPCDPQDCNGNGVDDTTDIRQGTSLDCNTNNIPDECDVTTGASLDCNFNGVPDECELDCNANGIPDECDLIDLTSEDCNGNGVPDECDLTAGASLDCNTNNVPDECDVASGFSVDCDGGPVGLFGGGQAIFDNLCFSCHGRDGSGGSGPDIRDYSRVDIWTVLGPINGVHPGGQHPEYTQQTYADLEAFLSTTGSSRGRPDLVPDECQTTLADCDGDGVSDACELEAGTQVDTDYDGVPDDCGATTGACCLAGGGCAVQSQSDCQAAGGSYRGDASGCADDADGDGVSDCADNCPLPNPSQADCNGNGVGDTCDVDPADPDGNGQVSPDCDGNGVPDSCDGAAGDVTSPTVACPADATVACTDPVDPAALGTATATDDCDPAPAIAFTDSAASGPCAGTLVITRTWTATDASGNQGQCVQTITTTDTAAPILTVPANVSHPFADAGQCSAVVTVGLATATDACDPAPTVSYQRSDRVDPDVGLGDPYPATGFGGPVTITWTATDACGNESQATQTVSVAPLNEIVVDIRLQPLVAPDITQCIELIARPCGDGPDVTVTTTVTFDGGGNAYGLSVGVPCGPTYECVTVRDTHHSLRRTLGPADGFGIVGVQYVADLISAGKTLTLGNLNDDGAVDILDYSVFAAMFGQAAASATCETKGLHADVNGNGFVDTLDFTFIAINFLDGDDTACCGGASPIAPRSRVSVGELLESGLDDLVAGDLNGDRWIDEADIAAFAAGARPVRQRRCPADVNADGSVDARDLMATLARWGMCDACGSDVNDDGRVDAVDVEIVLRSFGACR